MPRAFHFRHKLAGKSLLVAMSMNNVGLTNGSALDRIGLLRVLIFCLSEAEVHLIG